MLQRWGHYEVMETVIGGRRADRGAGGMQVRGKSTSGGVAPLQSPCAPQIRAYSSFRSFSRSSLWKKEKRCEWYSDTQIDRYKYIHTDRYIHTLALS